MSVPFSSPIAQYIIKVTGAIPSDVAVINGVLTITLQDGELSKRDHARLRYELRRWYDARYDKIAIHYTNA